MGLWVPKMGGRGGPGERRYFGVAPQQDGDWEDGAPHQQEQIYELTSPLITEQGHGSCPGSPALPHHKTGRGELYGLGVHSDQSFSASKRKLAPVVPRLSLKRSSKSLLPSFQFLSSCLYHPSNQTSGSRGQVHPAPTPWLEPFRSVRVRSETYLAGHLSTLPEPALHATTPGQRGNQLTSHRGHRLSPDPCHGQSQPRVALGQRPRAKRTEGGPPNRKEGQPWGRAGGEGSYCSLPGTPPKGGAGEVDGILLPFPQQR